MPRPSSSRGRKSAAQKAAETLRGAKYHPAPKTLTERAAEIWTHVVQALPESHFYPSDFPVLEEYCETKALIERMRKAWDGNPTVIKNNGDEVVSPTLTAINRNQQCLQALAGKLKICPSARVSSHKAGSEKPKRQSVREGLMK